MLKYASLVTFAILLISPFLRLNAQSDKLRLTGDYYLTTQYYVEDDAIESGLLPNGERVGVNSALSLNLTWKRLSAGLRYEAYLPPLLGFETNLDGHGLTNLFVNYSQDAFDLTAGSFYEQLGSGMLLRSYYEPQLGLDNSIFGFRAKYNNPKFRATILSGKNRRYFDLDDSWITAADLEFSIQELLPNSLGEFDNWTLGFNMVRKDETNETGLDIPENSSGYSIRSEYSGRRLRLGVEYGRKENEPHSLNQFRNTNGQALFLSAGYSVKGLGFNLNWRYMENMFFRSDRESLSNVTSAINYLPPTSIINTYRLTTLYPYATQGNGENGFNVEFFANIKKGTPLGGKYGTKISTDFSLIKSPEYETGLRQDAKFLSFSDSVYYINWNVEVNKRVNRKLNYSFGWSYIRYNKDAIEGIPRSGFINSFIVFSELTKKLANRKFVRAELQHLTSKQDRGSWAFGLIEFGWSARVSTYISDEWNYDSSIHYYSGGINYRKGATAVGLSYVRERSGLICIGGVCRFVPASNGLKVSVNTSF